MTQTAGTTSRTERLDRLPFTREHGRLVVGSGLGWALDAMDVGLISFVMAALAGAVGAHPDRAVAGSGRSASSAWRWARPSAGCSPTGSAGARSSPLTLLVFGLATGAAALSWSVGALLVFRFLIGLGLGAELPVASTLVSEFAPARLRGRVVVALEAFWAVGWTLAALIGYFVVPPQRRRLALGAGARRGPGAVRGRRPPGAAGVGALPGAARAGRRGRGRRPPVRGRRPASSPVPSPVAGPAGAAPGPRGALGARDPRADRGAVDGLVLHQLRVLRRLHLAADAALRRRASRWSVLRLHARHHAGPAARVRRGGRT